MQEGEDYITNDTVNDSHKENNIAFTKVRKLWKIKDKKELSDIKNVIVEMKSSIDEFVK